jgi:hypothetical protein
VSAISLRTGWPASAATLSAIIRATKSVGPPAGNATISRIGRAGKSGAADAAPAASNSTASNQDRQYSGLRSILPVAAS